METVYTKGYDKLKKSQKEILEECINKKSGGLSLSMGSGKTIISILLSISLSDNNPVIVVAGKSLISGWEEEIKKFFGIHLKYEIFHKSVLGKEIDKWKINPETKIILTTPEVLVKYYKENKLSNDFVDQRYVNGGVYENHYSKIYKPLLTHRFGGGYLYSIKWGCLIVDEVQKYTNVNTQWCQSISSLHSSHRWVLSGTMFDEPKPERILGYGLILNLKNIPRSLPETKLLIKSPGFRGIGHTMVVRKNNVEFIPPKVNEEIVSASLSKEESIIYTMMKKVLVEVKNRASLAKLVGDKENAKIFNASKLSMLLYLRQALVCPIIPLASVIIDSTSVKKRSVLSTIIMEELAKLKLDKWLNDTESVKSTRVKSVLSKVNKHQNEKVVIFSCFQTIQDILIYYLPKDRKVFKMSSSMSSSSRGKLIKKFEKSENGILILSYQMGAEGLNLQFASTVMLVDFWWNASKTQQAIARIFRYGQTAEEINVYFFSGNTALEKIMFEKQKAKISMIGELMSGSIKTKIPMIKTDEIIRLIELEDNKQSIRDIKYY